MAKVKDVVVTKPKNSGVTGPAMKNNSVKSVPMKSKPSMSSGSSDSGLSKKVEWALRIGVFGTFIGHGLFALSIKQSWFGYFTGVGIPESAIPTLLIMIGILDSVVALFALFKPVRAVLLWAVVWSVVTAMIRPITGDFFGLDFLDFVERAANFMAPLALIFFYGWPKGLKGWFSVKG